MSHDAEAIKPFKGWERCGGASEHQLNLLNKAFNIELPNDYLSFLRERNGGEGFIGSSYLVLWKAEELPVFNREYEAHIYAPSLILFGTDGGGEGYAFDTRDVSLPVVMVPFIGMELQYAKYVAASFSDFLRFLVAG